MIAWDVACAWRTRGVCMRTHSKSIKLHSLSENENENIGMNAIELCPIWFHAFKNSTFQMRGEKCQRSAWKVNILPKKRRKQMRTVGIRRSNTHTLENYISNKCKVSMCAVTSSFPWLKHGKCAWKVFLHLLKPRKTKIHCTKAIVELDL